MREPWVSCTNSSPAILFTKAYWCFAFSELILKNLRMKSRFLLSGTPFRAYYFHLFKLATGSPSVSAKSFSKRSIYVSYTSAGKGLIDDVEGVTLSYLSSEVLRLISREALLELVQVQRWVLPVAASHQSIKTWSYLRRSTYGICCQSVWTWAGVAVRKL